MVAPPFTERTFRTWAFEASLANCFGLRALHTFLHIPFLAHKREAGWGRVSGGFRAGLGVGLGGLWGGLCGRLAGWPADCATGGRTARRCWRPGCG